MSCHVMLKITGGNGLQNPKIHRKKDFYRQLYKLQLLVVLSFFLMHKNDRFYFLGMIPDKLDCN